MFPNGVGILFSKPTRVRLMLVIAGYVGLSLLDTVGVASMVPLMTILSGGNYQTGIVGTLWTALGSPSAAVFTQYIAIIAVLAFLLKGVFGIVSRWWSLGFLMRQQNETAIGLMRSYLLAPYSLHRERNTTEFIEIIKATVPASYSAINAALSFTAELATILAVSATLIVVDPGLALVALAFFGVSGLVFQAVIRNRSRHLGAQMIESSISATKAIMHGFGGIKEVKLRNNPTPFVSEFAQAQRRLSSSQRVATLISELPKYFFEILFVSGIAILSVVMFSSRDSAQALGSLAMFGAAGFRLLPSATRLLASFNGARLGNQAIEKLIGELSMVHKLNSRSPTVGLLSYSGEISIHDVDFSYGTGKAILKDINLKIPRGSSLAVVGASGAGKTTLIDLLLGLQEPNSGTITCGGLSIYESLADWQSNIGFVPQDVFLMDASLQENIVFDEHVDDVDVDRLNDAIRRSQLDGLVEASPEGLNVRVGDRGVKLSGGQRQRVGIARALYRQPSVLVLDEATSALDNETEQRITETIEALGGDVTVVVVAHRLSTVKGCDQFVMLNNGRVESAGTFSTVVEKSPSFAKMVKLASLDIS
ncbi:MAG: ABC transporter ATP-binding protein [Actinomycetales bacterium]|nr:ABC transporter ATP-binding protein [Actinomycetales bacterium]